MNQVGNETCSSMMESLTSSSGENKTENGRAPVLTIDDWQMHQENQWNKIHFFWD